VVTANSTISFIGASVHENAIIDAQYLEPADATPLHLSDVTYPRSITRREHPQILWRVVGSENLTIFDLAGGAACGCPPPAASRRHGHSRNVRIPSS